ncbi:isoprenylcysteine carboxylmethyltransferase family protein [Variovorax sp. Sphag1AA]|uniref:methyltransferase family protein n=1 Tax=Variovorax sp. Sphag1AA TaxID=2587027 RepID=UPI001612C549|nr:isoprenylcysteine carboxylmethyltransferase family protein [Variovorax sp. Sphag1AA]MBB3178432.1 protein-S-isoprenylcysteine O-methyltransferase Ste14 [Variovorax sp. Sphag1AA]
MSLVYRHTIPALWFTWAVYWLVVSREVKVTVRRESVRSRLLHIVPLAVALGLLWVPTAPIPLLGIRIVPRAAWAFWVGASLTLAGLLFSVWARAYLGRNWSAVVTLKQDHELITTGPYSLVRHPIYTGLLLAFVGSAIARGTVAGVVAVALASLALWRKLRMEERWMGEQFGEKYVAYRRRVAALVPFVL